MRKFAFALALMFSLALLLMAQTQYVPGTVVTSLSAVTTTGPGTAFATQTINGVIPNKFTWNTLFATAGPTSLTINLEGSNDTTACSTATCTEKQWFQLDQSTSNAFTSATVNGEMRHVVNKPIRFLRCNLTNVVIGGNTGITCKFIVTGN